MTHRFQPNWLKPTTAQVAAAGIACVYSRFRKSAGGPPSN